MQKDLGGPSLFFEPQSPHLYNGEYSTFHVAKLCGEERSTLSTVALLPASAWHVR